MKNIPYSLIAKCIAIILIIIAVLILLDFQFISNKNDEAFYKENFYETDTFQENYVRLSHNVVEKQLDLVDQETIENNRVGVDVIISKSRLEAIEDNLRRAPSFLYLLINKETGESITNIDPKVFEIIDESNDRTILEDNSDYTLEDYITNFKTVVQWDNSGVYFPVNSVMEDQPFVYLNYSTSSEFNSTNVNAKDVVYRLRNSDWLYYTAVDFTLMQDDIFFGNDYYRFNKDVLKIKNYIPLVIMSLITIFLAFIYLAVVIGRVNPDEDAKLFFYDYIPLEIQTFCVLLAAIPIGQFFDLAYESNDETALRYQLAIRSAILVVAILTEGLSILRLVKTKYIFKNPLVFKFSWWIQGLFTMDFLSPLVRIKVLFIIVAYMGMTSLVAVILWLDFSFPIPILVILFYILAHIGLVIYILAIIREISSLITATKKRVEGETDYPIYEEDFKLGLKVFAKDLNALQSGLQIALKEAIKGEKLKTELITNVSHDLKNPLTSIVTYIDLLDKNLRMYNDAEISSEQKTEIQGNMEGYIDILNKKSYRLSSLIEDLVEASKASSGNIVVDLMNINIRQLILQCLGEKEDLFIESNLEVVLSPLSGGPLWTLVDPNHMYRVFDNILSNMIKYSLSNTRVFINVTETEDDAVITFKNISNHPLDNNTKDLSKRFVRGDESRSTEGSGLGLSIVESLLELQNGNQEIKIDGDLFKLLVRVPRGVNPKDIMLAPRVLIGGDSDEEVHEFTVEGEIHDSI